MKVSQVTGLLKDTFTEWSDDRAARLAASLAYYTIFSLVPLLVVVITLAGMIGRGSAVQGEVMSQMSNLVGQEGAAFIQDLVNTSASRPQTGIIATIVGTITLLLGALGVFGALQDSLNTIWEVKLKPAKGLWGTIKRQVVDRFLSFTMVLGIGFLLLVSMVVNALLAALGQYMSNLLPFPGFVMTIINFVVSFAVITLMFALMFKILPDAEMAWRDVWLGAAFTSLLFTIGKVAIATYLGRSSIGSSYGAAGSLVLILVWIYYSAQILFLGAEFTQVYASKYGSGIQPDPDAEILTELDRARQGMTRSSGSQSQPQAQTQRVLAPTGAEQSLTPERMAQRQEAYQRQYVQRELGPDATPDALEALAAAQAQGGRPVYRTAEAALEVESKDARMRNPVAPVMTHASRVTLPGEPANQESVFREVAAPLALSWVGALLIGTLVHFSFLRPKQRSEK